MSENALTTTQTMLAMPRNLFLMTDQQIARIKLLAEMYAASAFNQKKNDMKAGDFFLLIVKGCELGLPPMAAIDFISIIHGRPCLDGKGMLALINASGELEDIVFDQQDAYCDVTMQRKGRSSHTERFSQHDADLMKTTAYIDGSKKTISLSQKDNWLMQPRTMRKWRAVSACARVVFSDITGGLMTTEEMGALMGLDVVVDDDGNMEILPAKPNQATPVQQPTLTIVPKSEDDNTSPSPSTQPGEVTTADFTPPATTATTPTPDAPHWSKDPDKIKMLVESARKAGYIEKTQGEAGLLELLGKPNFDDYPTGQAASNAIKAAAEALKQSTPPKAGDKPNPFIGMQSGTSAAHSFTFSKWIVFHLADGKTATWREGRKKLDALLNISGFKFEDITERKEAYDLAFAVQIDWEEKAHESDGTRYRKMIGGSADQNDIDAWLAASKPAPKPAPLKSEDVPVGADGINF